MFEDPKGDDAPTPRSTRRTILALAGALTAGQAASAVAAEPAAPSPAAEARLKLAREAMEAVRAQVGRGRFRPGERDPLWIWSRRRLEARLELARTRTERVAAAQEHLDEMKATEQLVTREHEAGEVDRLALMEAQYRRLEAVSWLEREAKGS
jgi:hypothetical protein